MKCDDCNGTGESEIQGQTCFLCNGMGEMCDVCGDAVDEAGQNVCPACQSEKEGEE